MRNKQLSSAPNNDFVKFTVLLLCSSKIHLISQPFPISYLVGSWSTAQRLDCKGCC